MKRLLLLASATLALVVSTHTARANEPWETDFEKARAQAAAAGKYMLLDFTGSDWCSWCIKLDKEVFRQEAFKAYAKTELVCVELDFPSKKKISDQLKKQNKELAAKYGVRGYPTILILSPRGELVQKTGYRKGGAEKYVDHLKGIIEAHKKAGAGGTAAEKNP